MTTTTTTDDDHDNARIQQYTKRTRPTFPPQPGLGFGVVEEKLAKPQNATPNTPNTQKPTQNKTHKTQHTTHQTHAHRSLPGGVLSAHEHLRLALELTVCQRRGVKPPEHVCLLQGLELGMIQALKALHDCRRGFVLVSHRHLRRCRRSAASQGPSRFCSRFGVSQLGELGRGGGRGHQRTYGVSRGMPGLTSAKTNPSETTMRKFIVKTENRLCDMLRVKVRNKIVHNIQYGAHAALLQQVNKSIHSRAVFRGRYVLMHRTIRYISSTGKSLPIIVPVFIGPP